MKPDVVIYPGNTLAEFFREQVVDQSLKHNLQLADMTEFYLVNLLVEHEKRISVVDGEPLAIKLSRALTGDSATQVKELKLLGDSALYMAGYFPDHIKSGVVGVGYYIDMGSGAYSSLAGIMFADKTFSGLYSELSEKFSPLVHILTHMAESTR